MIERRKHRRLSINCWASMKHPLLGTITAEVEEISFSGLSVKLDESLNLFVMMELDMRLHGDEWDEGMPDLPVQVVRIEERQVALKFCQSFDSYWIPPVISGGESADATQDDRDTVNKENPVVAARSVSPTNANTTGRATGLNKTAGLYKKAPRKKGSTAKTKLIPPRLVPYSQ